MTPYNTGRVKVGLGWTPAPRTQFGHYELQIQRALLDRSTLKPAPLWRRVLGAIWRHL